MNDFSTSFTVDQSPDEAFAAINRVREWWTGEITGGTDQLGDEFTYRYEDVHRSTQQVVELVPGSKVVWLVTDADLSFTADREEWTGTQVVFEIRPRDGQTEVTFTHVGLAPEVECFESCSNAWGYFVNTSLRALIVQQSA